MAIAKKAKNTAHTREGAHYKWTLEDAKMVKGGQMTPFIEKELTGIIGAACDTVGKTWKNCDNDEWVQAQSEAYLDMVKSLDKVIERGDESNIRSWMLGAYIWGMRSSLNRQFRPCKRRQKEAHLVTNLGHFEPPTEVTSQQEVLDQMELLYGKTGLTDDLL